MARLDAGPPASSIGTGGGGASPLWGMIQTALRGEVTAPRALGFEITIRNGPCAPGRWSGEVDFHPSAANSQGVFHGGFLSAVLDVAMGYASLTLLDADELQRTLEMKINYLRSAPPGSLRVDAEVLRRGKRTAYCEGSVRDGSGELLARSSATFSIRRKEPS